MITVYLVLLVITTEATLIPKRYLFARVLRVDPADHSLYTLSSNTGIPNPVACAANCKSKECLSFSYYEVDQRCETYSRFLNEEKDGDISATKTFSKLIFQCSDISTESPSGVYEITTTEGKRVDRFCDTDTAGGPWTVIQRRTSGDVNFYRSWTDYKNGFGDIQGNFWIGNDKLHLLTTTPRILRVELEAWDGTQGYAQYSEFQVANEEHNYKLSLTGFSGNISYDAMAYHNGRAFTTYDKDNDIDIYSCATTWSSAWWYGSCYESHLNGQYVIYNGMQVVGAMVWRKFPYTQLYDIPLKKTKMMILLI